MEDVKTMDSTEIRSYLSDLGAQAQKAKTALQRLDTARKNQALRRAADALVQESEKILFANEKDYARAEEAGMAEGLLDRLKLTTARIESMAEGLRQIADLPDPVGEVMEQFDRDGDLTGSAVYLDAYDPFLYVNTDSWEQNMRLLAMLEGDLDCRDGGADVFLRDPEPCLLILSIPFLADHPELAAYEILADNGQYLLIRKP